MRPPTVLLLALVLVLGPAASAPAADFPDEAGAAITRYPGGSRYETAELLAKAAFPDGTEVAVIARADAFPDALAAAYLAGEADAPVLLADTHAVPEATARALRDLGIQRVFLLGNEEAIGRDVQRALEDAGYAVTRIGGQTRTETARRIAENGADVGTVSAGPAGEKRTAILAYAGEFADALASGPLAYANHHPILLTYSDELHPDARAALEDERLGIEQVLIVGGTTRISDRVEQQLTEMGLLVQRLFGPERTATAAALAVLTAEVMGWSYDLVGLALGQRFPDALAMAPFAGATRSVLVLSQSVDGIGQHTFNFFALTCPVRELAVAGGDLAVSPRAANQASLAARCPDLIVDLSGAKEVADGEPGAGDPDGFGLFTLFLVDADTFCYATEVIGIDPATAAHIHRGRADENGPPVVGLTPPDGSGYAFDCADSDQLGEVLAAPDAFYVNVHDGAYPDGALRAQLGPSLAAHLSPDAETDGNGSYGLGDEGGSGSALLFMGAETVCFEVAYVTEPDADAGHIHRGRVDQAGGIAITLFAQPQGGFVYDCADEEDFELAEGQTREELLADLEADPTAYYVNLHNPDRPQGAVRGQLGADAAAFLDGDQEVDEEGQAGAGDVNGFGEVSFYRGADDSVLCFELFALSIVLPADAAHIHAGEAGTNGPVKVALSPPREDGYVFGCADGSGGGDDDYPDESRTPSQWIDHILANPDQYYVNVHTSEYPAGAIRGQVMVPD